MDASVGSSDLTIFNNSTAEPGTLCKSEPGESQAGVASVSLRVAINAQLKSNAGVGGVQTVLIGLVHSLGQLEGPEKYILITPWEEPDWPRPYLGNNQTIVRGPKLQAAKRALSSPLMRLAKSAVRKASRMVGAGDIWRGLASNNGFYAGLGCHVLHFPYQHYVLSSIPS